MYIGIDIGTTTIAALLTDKNGTVLAQCTLLNRQKVFGFDVLARIKAACKGRGDKLRTYIQEDLLTVIHHVLNQAKKMPDEVQQITLAANTPMVHFLMGYPCGGLGIYPFTPYSLESVETDANTLLHTDCFSCTATVLPGISSYIGGDIASGMYELDFDRADSLSFLLDLGTNGEMVLGTKEGFLSTSAAAGPAFEGGNISCGTGGIPGAISHVVIDNHYRPIYETIGRTAPVGICGSGILELTAQLLNHRLIDKSGLLHEPFFRNGYPLAVSPSGKKLAFTQKDVRQLQMAKSAIRGGIMALCSAYGCAEEDIKHIFLAGGFGQYTNLDAAVQIGLIPACFLEKIKTVGNTSLLGAVKYGLMPEESLRRITSIREKTAEVYLGNSAVFSDAYIKNMDFVS